MTTHQPIGYNDLPGHDDLIVSAVNYLTQAKTSLCRQYQQTHSDTWATDRPLVEATRLVNQALRLLAESRPARPPGEAAAPPFAAAARPAHRPAREHPVGGAGTTTPDLLSGVTWTGVTTDGIQVGSAWIGPYFEARR